MIKPLNYLFLVLGLMACGPSGQTPSLAKDISLAGKKILYLEGDEVFLQLCEKVSKTPDTRTCSRFNPADSMPLEEYLKKLPKSVDSAKIGEVLKSGEGLRYEEDQDEYYALVAPFTTSLDSQIKSIADVVELMKKSKVPDMRFFIPGIIGRDAVRFSRTKDGEARHTFERYYKEFTDTDEKLYISAPSSYRVSPLDLEKGSLTLSIDECKTNFSFRQYKNFMLMSVYLTGSCIDGTEIYDSALFIRIY